MPKYVYTECTPEEAKAVADKIGLSGYDAIRMWAASGDHFDRTGFLAECIGGTVMLSPLWGDLKNTDTDIGIDLPDVFDACPSVEWFAKATLQDLGGEPELVGADGSKLAW